MSKYTPSKQAVSVNQLTALVSMCVQVNEIPLVLGSPGIGKSAVYREVAESFNMDFLDFRLSMADPMDLIGLPHTNKETERMTYALPNFFPLEGDEIPTGKAGWLISFEEINSAPPALQAIAYKILHDRMIGDKKLHPNVRLVANGNLETDGAIVEPLSSALASRMILIEAFIDPKEWLKWAGSTTCKVDFNPIVLAYLNFKQSNVHNFNPSSADKSYPCPRTWEKVSKLLYHFSPKDSHVRSFIEGAVGAGCAVDFYTFIKFFDEVPKLSDVLGKGLNAPVPSELGIKYATVVSFASQVTEQNITELTDYFLRLNVNDFSPEHFFVFMKAANKTLPGLVKFIRADQTDKLISLSGVK